MDRRKFLKVLSCIGLGGLVAWRGPRLYGEPKSSVPIKSDVMMYPHLIKLHLSLENIAKEKYEHLLALSQLAMDVLSNSNVASAFAQDSKGYFARIGFPKVSIEKDSIEWKLIAALAAPEVKNAAVSGNVTAFIEALKNYGLDTGTMLASNRSTTFVTETAAAVVVVVVVAAAAVALPVYVAIRGESLEEYLNAMPEAQLAMLMSGKHFASDVVKSVAIQEFVKLSKDIKNERIVLPKHISKEKFISDLKTVLERHLP